MEPLADLQPAGVPQFEGSGFPVCVKNTFIDVDDRLPDLVRSKTAPARDSRNGDSIGLSSSDQDEEHAEGPLSGALLPPDKNTECSWSAR